jgi:transaldolase
MTIPKNILMEWSTFGVTKDPAQYPFALSELTPLVYEDVLEKDWVLYQIEHPLTDKGLQKFADDWNNLLKVSS